MKNIILLIAILIATPICTLAVNNLWEFYNERNMNLPTVENRAELAETYGIEDYSGTYKQNQQLLGNLLGLGGSGDPMQPSGISVNIRESLVSGSSRSATTLKIDPMKTLDDHSITFSDFNSSKVYAKLDQGTDNEEIMYFTGITDNTDYYTLTGCVWGCNFYNTTCDVDANKKKHNAGSSFQITTDFHFINENFVSLDSTQTIGAVKTYSVLPECSLTATTSDQFTTKNYVDNVALQGAATSTETQAGIVELATGAEIASTTELGANRPLVIPSSLATSSPDVRGLYVPVAENDGYLNQGWLDLSENWSFTGATTFSATTTMATTTMDAGTISTTPTSSNDIVNKDYVDNNAINYSMLCFGASDNTADNQTEYLPPPYGSGSVTEKNTAIIASATGTASDLYASMPNNVLGDGAVATFTFRVDEQDTSLTVTGATTTTSDLSNSATFSPGELLAMELAITFGSGTSGNYPRACVKIRIDE